MTKSAKISIILAVIIFLMPFGFYLLEDYIGAGVFHLLLYLFFVILFFIIIGKSVGQTKNESNRFKENAHIWIPTAIVILSLVITFFPRGMIIDTYDIKCMNKLRGLYVGFEFYKDDNNLKYPDASKWCDLIREKGYIPSEVELICPAIHDSNERCSYAINPACEPNSPGDVVLLFESKKPEWNQYGGAELINPKSHFRKNWFWGYWYSGSCVLFNNGEEKFVAAKDFKKLRWK